MNETNKLKCPNCDFEIDIQSILYQQIKSKTQKESKEENTKKEKALKAEKQKIDEDKKQLEIEKEAFQQKTDKEVKGRLKSEKPEIEKQIRKEVEEETAERIKLLEKNLDARSEERKELNKSKSEVEMLKRQKDELKGEIEAKAEATLNEKLKEGMEKFQKKLKEETDFKMSVKIEEINSLKKEIDGVQRKAQQGLPQRQGEVQELAIEKYLKEQFPFDSIDEIKKGTKGADCLQTVNNKSDGSCGTIYYESKRTKGFQKNWIEKFKNDIREKDADVGVLVTEVLPKDMERFGQKDGIWICTFDEFKGLCFVLREAIINVHSARLFQENKGGKMGILYDFLTSNQFKSQIEAIVGGFVQMETDLASERRGMEAMWKKRESQIKTVIQNTSHMYNTFKGIAGNEILSVKQLELSNFNEVEHIDDNSNK